MLTFLPRITFFKKQNDREERGGQEQEEGEEEIILTNGISPGSRATSYMSVGNLSPLSPQNASLER